MENSLDIKTQQPLGRILSRLGKSYLQLLNTRLNYLDIERNYYALLLIELGESKITQNELILISACSDTINDEIDMIKTQFPV